MGLGFESQPNHIKASCWKSIACLVFFSFHFTAPFRANRHLVGWNPCNGFIFIYLQGLLLICIKNAFFVGLQMWSTMDWEAVSNVINSGTQKSGNTEDLRRCFLAWLSARSDANHASSAAIWVFLTDSDANHAFSAAIWVLQSQNVKSPQPKYTTSGG